MKINLTDPIKPIIKILETMRKMIEKKVSAQAVTFLAVTLVATIIILLSQLFVALLLIRVLGL